MVLQLNCQLASSISNSRIVSPRVTVRSPTIAHKGPSDTMSIRYWWCRISNQYCINMVAMSHRHWHTFDRPLLCCGPKHGRDREHGRWPAWVRHWKHWGPAFSLAGEQKHGHVYFGNGDIHVTGESRHGTGIVCSSISIHNNFHLTLSSSSPANSTAGTTVCCNAGPSDIDKAAISQFKIGGIHANG